MLRACCKAEGPAYVKIMFRGRLHPRLATICLVVAALAMGSTPSASAQEIIRSLGSPGFAVDPAAATAAYEQSASGLIFNGNYALGDTLGGAFAEQDWSSRSGFGVFMVLTGANPSLPFSVEFFDADFNVINTYEGTTEPLVAGTPTFVPLALNLPGTGVLTKVGGVQFTWGSGGAVNVLVQGIAAAAIPKPSPAFQKITFNPKKTQKFRKGRQFTLTATASSGLPVEFGSSNAKILSIVDRTATIHRRGPVIITARQGGNASYKAAKAVPREITIE